MGIDAPEADGISISIQPNPTAQLAVLSVAGTDMPQMLYLYDLNGKQVAQQPAHSSHQNGIWQTSIDLRAVPWTICPTSCYAAGQLYHKSSKTINYARL
ncbi:MAG: hypothetical protein IPL33_03620 [Sphingobacteriales bacterium]|nr:hypothetical protein [Sphingobacteriales bacterium]